jgi:hypothetical protein
VSKDQTSSLPVAQAKCQPPAVPQGHAAHHPVAEAQCQTHSATILTAKFSHVNIPIPNVHMDLKLVKYHCNHHQFTSTTNLRLEKMPMHHLQPNYPSYQSLQLHQLLFSKNQHRHFSNHHFEQLRAHTHLYSVHIARLRSLTKPKINYTKPSSQYKHQHL